MLDKVPPSPNRSVLKEWFSSNVREEVIQVLSGSVQSSVDRVKECYRLVESFLKLDKDAPPEAAGDTMAKIAAVSIEDDISSMREAAVGNLQSVRVESLDRMFKLLILVCQSLLARPLKLCDDGHVELVGRLFIQHRSCSQFLDAHRHQSVDLCQGWFAEVAVLDKAILCSQTAVSDSLSAFGDEMKSHVEHVNQACPPSSLIENPKLCNNVDLQKALLDNPRRAELSTSLQALSDGLRAWKMLRLKGVESHKRDVESAKRAKDRAKTAVGVEYAMRKILREPPEEAHRVPEHAKRIMAKLKEKGIATPAFLAQLLDSMQAAAVTKEADAT